MRTITEDLNDLLRYHIWHIDEKPIKLSSLNCRHLLHILRLLNAMIQNDDDFFNENKDDNKESFLTLKIIGSIMIVTAYQRLNLKNIKNNIENK